MGVVKILEETTKLPITLIGKRAGYCWAADVSDDKKNYRRGLECIESGHGRTLEFPNVEMVISGYSARVIREWYTHLGGAPTRLQASTRYINYKNFPYVTPKSIRNDKDALKVYEDTMAMISKACECLEEVCKIPREDAAMLLPLGMETVIVDKRNLRNLIDMSRQRMCTRAYWEFRQLFFDILQALSEYSDEWDYIVNTQMMPKCKVLGYCPEKNGCGYTPKKAGEQRS